MLLLQEACFTTYGGANDNPPNPSSLDLREKPRRHLHSTLNVRIP